MGEIKIIKSTPDNAEDRHLSWHLAAIKSYFDRTLDNPCIWTLKQALSYFENTIVDGYLYDKRKEFKDNDPDRPIEAIELFFFAEGNLIFSDYYSNQIRLRIIPSHKISFSEISFGFDETIQSSFANISVRADSFDGTYRDTFSDAPPESTLRFIRTLQRYVVTL